MYKVCPKCRHERTAAEEQAAQDSCPACGVIYAKYLQSRFAVPAAAPRPAKGQTADDEPGRLARIAAAAMHVPEDATAAGLWARAALYAALVVYGVRLAAMDIPSWEMAASLIHLPMVPIHEFGHILFRPFGEFMTLLGGSLFQVALPLVFGGVFLARNRDPFAASVMLWWSAVAVMDVAPYIYDAHAPQHVLLTGRTGETGAHDFIDVLYDLGLLKQAREVGRATHAFGMAMLAASFAWGALVLLKSRRIVKENG